MIQSLANYDNSPNNNNWRVMVSSVMLSKNPIVLHKHYSRRLIYKLWQAFRAEKIAYIGGRDRFLNFVCDEVINACDRYDVSYKDGGEFLLGDFPAAETLEDFYASKSMMIDIVQLSREAPAGIKTRVNTIHFVHLFLWSRRYDVLSGWECLEETYDPIISRISGDFERLQPSLVIRNPVLIYKVNNDRDRINGIDYIFNKKLDRDYSISNHGWLFSGAFHFFNTTDPYVDKYLFFHPDEWERLNSGFIDGDYRDPKRYNKRSPFVHGIATAIRAKDFFLPLANHGLFYANFCPEITKRKFHIACRFRAGRELFGYGSISYCGDTYDGDNFLRKLGSFWDGSFVDTKCSEDAFYSRFEISLSSIVELNGDVQAIPMNSVFIDLLEYLYNIAN